MAFGTSVRHVIRESVVWASVLGAGFAGVYFFDDIRNLFAHSRQAVVQAYESTAPSEARSSDGFERLVTLRADRTGHFYARAYVNGRPIAVMVDTGATSIALSHEDARTIGVEPGPADYTSLARTANGIVRTAPVKLDSIRIGDVEVRNLRGSVAQPGNQHITLLGMEFIRRLGRFELRGDELILVE